MPLKKRLGAALRAFMNPALRPPPVLLPPAPTPIVVDKLMEGRNALVTGAGRNIGKSVALELLAHGANVYCTEMDAERCASLHAELSRQPGTSRVFRADITKAAETEAMLKALKDDQVTIDLLVNNVGIVTDDFELSFKTNVTGPVDLTNRIVRGMIDANIKGSIIFLTSIHQESLFTRAKAYAPSKAAVGMLIKQMAVELAPHRIRVNGIAPGDVREDEQGNVVRYGYTPLEGTSIRFEYIARAAIYLASEYFSRYTTGSIVTIDGGLSLFNYQCAFDAGLFP
jgi:NAD(P)-dependent dehydrogenase (short-subunit alcohol dehydrogenase family)